MSGLEKEVQGRVALDTGGSRGIGQAVCLALARNGADIALNYVANADAAKQTQSEVEGLGVRCVICQADVRSMPATPPTISATRRSRINSDFVVSMPRSKAGTS